VVPIVALHTYKLHSDHRSAHAAILETARLRDPVYPVLLIEQDLIACPPEHERGRTMATVAAILKHKGYQVSTVDPTSHISDVAALLAERRIGAVLVMDKAEQMLGIVSERDIVRCLAANGASTLEMTAGQLMTRAVQVAHPETTVDQAMQMMTAGRFRHLPVIDHDTLIGLISIGDVVKARIIDQDTVVESLTAYVTGSA
jgi:CBS domain-containing protein